QLPGDVQALEVGLDVKSVKGARRPVEPGENRSLRGAGSQREGSVTSTLGGRSGDGDAQPMIGAGQVGQLPDVVDALLVTEPSLLRALDGHHRAALHLVEGAVVDVALLRELEPGEEPQAVGDDVAAERGPQIPDVSDVPAGGDHRRVTGNLRGGSGQRAG